MFHGYTFKEQRFTIVGNKGSLVFLTQKRISYDCTIQKLIKKQNQLIATHQKLSKLEIKNSKRAGNIFLQCLKKRKIEINDINHAYKVVSFLENVVIK